MRRSAPAILSLVLIWGQSAHTQPIRPRNLANVKIGVSVRQQADANFTYVYRATNDQQSLGICDVMTLMVVDSLLWTNRTTIELLTNKKWYMDGNGASAQSIGGAAAGKFLELPSGNELYPGESMGFAFTSKGLPWIGEYRAKSFAAPFSSTEVESLMQAGIQKDRIYPDWTKDSHNGLTVVPNTRLNRLTTYELIDTLRHFLDQSTTIGWIGNVSIAARLESRLLLVRDLLLRASNEQTSGDPMSRVELELKRINKSWIQEFGRENVPDSALTASEHSLGEFESAKKLTSFDKRPRALILAAKLVLRSIVTEVEILYRLSERGPKIYLTSEAYALVKFNTEYLIERL